MLPERTRLPARCQDCVPGFNCVFFLCDDADDDCACPERARVIALDVLEAGRVLRDRRVNLNDQVAVKAALLPTEWVENVEDGWLDDFIDRAVECARGSNL
jgi:hypothetical protein